MARALMGRVDETRRERVEADPPRRVVGGGGEGEPDHGRLRRRVGVGREEPRRGGGRHDRARVRARAGGRLAQELLDGGAVGVEGGRQVQPQRLLESLRSLTSCSGPSPNARPLPPGDVQEPVEAAQLLHRLPHRAPRGIRLARVGLDHTAGGAAGACQGREARRGRRRGPAPPLLHTPASRRARSLLPSLPRSRSHARRLPTPGASPGGAPSLAGGSAARPRGPGSGETSATPRPPAVPRNGPPRGDGRFET